MEENVIKPIENEYLDSNFKFKEGNPGGGRPVESEEKKLIKKATKQIIAEYKDALAQALPYIEPVLISKAIEGDMVAIKEVHDRVMDKSKQPTDITSQGERIMYLPSEIMEKNGITQDSKSSSEGQA
jgi:hypothetical protein